MDDFTFRSGVFYENTKPESGLPKAWALMSEEIKIR